MILKADAKRRILEEWDRWWRGNGEAREATGTDAFFSTWSWRERTTLC